VVVRGGGLEHLARCTQFAGSHQRPRETGEGDAEREPDGLFTLNFRA